MFSRLMAGMVSFGVEKGKPVGYLEHALLAYNKHRDIEIPYIV